MRRLVATAACGVAALGASASTARAAAVRPAAPPPGCPVVAARAGNTSGDWEAVFGRRARAVRAAALLRRVRGKGFHCAVIEHEQGTHEVAVIALRSRAAAQKVARRARRAGLAARVARS